LNENAQTLELVQQELDLTGETLETVWNTRSQEEAQNWTEEALCVQWLSPKSAPDWDWWRGLRRYEREAWLNDYRHGRFLVESGIPMPTATCVYAARQERWKQTTAIAESWSKDRHRAAYRDDPRNGILLCREHHRGRQSAHNSPRWFLDWLDEHRPEQAAWVRETRHKLTKPL